MLKENIKERLEEIDPEFEWGCMAVCLAESAYIELPVPRAKQIGHEIVLTFWAWGDDEDEIWANLKRVFVNLFECLKVISDEIKKAGG